MLMLGNFSEEAQFVLLKAKSEMINLNHPYIGTEHLVLAILKYEDELSKKLAEFGLTYDKFYSEILTVIGKGSKKAEFFLYTPLLKKVMENALLDAKDNNRGEVTPEHLFSALLEEGEGIAIRIFMGMNLDLEDIYEEFTSKLIKRPRKKRKKLLIEELGINLVEKAKTKKVDPVVGREVELKRLIEILCRRTKNNPILIGEAGVGKTAIVEELANRIALGDVPPLLQDKKIISLDMATVVSGTKYRGEFEERMQKIIKEVSEEENIILFIDEIHTLVGAGGAEGAIDASNILKPALARGTIKCIGATTTSEYKKYIEEDKALERRFQQIMVEEPTSKETINIIEKLVPIYERYHHVQIPELMIKKMVELANQYIFDRHNPDKAIDVLDEVCSRVSIKETKQQRTVNCLRRELAEIQKNKTAVILDNNMEKAYEYLKEEAKITEQLKELELSKNNVNKVITLEDIAQVIHLKTKIPVYEIIREDLSYIDKLENDLKQIIIGQDNAIETLMKTTKKIKLGYTNHKVKSYLFVGPTGVGKTNLAKMYAQYFGGNNNLIRLDMSEYADATAINKIIGSSPGYVGYQDNYNILTKIKEQPTAIILLDEIDKAHPQVINLLYQMLDEGVIRDAKNNVVHLNHNLIIMTSNLGFEEIKVGFKLGSKQSVKTALKQKFSPSLINRIDEVIIFNCLSKEQIITILQKKMEKLKEKYPTLVYNDDLIEELAGEVEFEEYGARKIDKVIESRVENLIIERVLKKEKLVISHLQECQGMV